MNHRIFWVTGLPGSGKSYFSQAFQKYLQSQNLPCVILDGDEIRLALGNMFGYSRNDRVKLAKIYFNLAKIFVNQGNQVIVSTVSMFSEVYQCIEEENQITRIIYMETSSEILNMRDKKKLRSSNISESPGVSLVVDIPTSTYLALKGNENIDELEKIFEKIKIGLYE